MKKMNKFLSALIALMILIVPFAALAEPTQPALYELSAEDTVFTVRLPGAEGSFGWEFEISDPDSFELLTMETADDGAMIASFRGIAQAETTVSLILRGLFEGEQAATFTKVFEINISAENKLAVAAILQREPAAEWVEYDEEGYQLTVRLNGDHSFELVDPEAFDLLTMECTEEGAFAASFMTTMLRAGHTQIIFTADEGHSQHLVNIFICEDGTMFPQSVETFEILIPAA